METLTLRYEVALKAYGRLRYMVKKFIKSYEEYKDAFQQFNNSDLEEEHDFILHRDALIKRFEFCYELTWKLLKNYLQEKYSINVASPKKTFQACFEQKLITEHEAEEFLRMIDARNYSSHAYDEDQMQEISMRIVDYSALMEIVMKKIFSNTLQ
jgi:nucleotidyltransferase substrate binding protein (TIGR01987 family)